MAWRAVNNRLKEKQTVTNQGKSSNVFRRKRLRNWLGKIMHLVRFKHSYKQAKKELEAGQLSDAISLREILRKKHTILAKEKSDYQDICLVEAVDLRLYLNEQLQFSSLDERLYHEALVHPAIANAPASKSVLILGGGDGLALREVFKYKNIEKVVLVDIDQKVVSASQQVPSLVKLNQGSLLDPRVQIVIQDAWNYVFCCEASYDMIIMDFPDPTDESLARLYSLEMFRQVSKLLSKVGVMVCQANSPSEAPVVFWSIGKTIESAGFSTKSYYTIVPSFGDWGFHIGKRSVIKKINGKVAYFSKDCDKTISDGNHMFAITPSVLKKKKLARTNQLSDLFLHYLFKNL